MEQGVFLDLVAQNQIPEVVKGFEAAVATSFAEDQARDGSLIVRRVRRITRGDIQDRTRHCVEIFKVLRGDLKWSVSRILDELPRLLRAKLDGQDWKLPERACWTPEANRG